MAGKGNSRQDHQNRALPWHANEKASPQLLSEHDSDDDSATPPLSSVTKLIEIFRAETRCSMDTLQSTVDTFGSRLTVIETSLQDCDDRITELQANF